jgi:hypothetical protein
MIGAWMVENVTEIKGSSRQYTGKMNLSWEMANLESYRTINNIIGYYALAGSRVITQ